MSKNTHDMLNNPSINGSSSSKSTESYFPLPHSASAPPVEAEFPKTAFIDLLTSRDEKNEEIPGAEQRINEMRNMRFRPDKLYAEQNQRDQALKNDATSRYYTQNGVRFLKPNQNALSRFTQTDFSADSKVEVIESRGFFNSLFRGISMFFQSLTLFGGIRLLAKTKQILPGNFGYAMNFNGNIEIYPDSPDRRVGVSPYTNIQVAPINSKYVNIFNRIHLVNVPEGKYALATKDRHPVFLPPGRHFIESTDFQLQLDDKSKEPTLVDKNQPIIKNGDSYIIRVPQGKVGHGDIGGKTVILEPEYNDFDSAHGTREGAYIFHDPKFNLGVIPTPLNAKPILDKENKPVLDHFQNTGNELVTLGPVRVLTVVQTHAAVTEKNGQLEIYGTGRHPMVTAQHVYKDKKFDLTQQKMDVTKVSDSKSDSTVDYNNNNNKDKENKDHNEEIFISADGVQLKVKAHLLFRVVDVEKCMKNVGVDDYQENIKARTLHILRELIKSSNYLNPQELHGEAPSVSQTKEIQIHDPHTAQSQLLSSLGATLRKRLQEQLSSESGIELHDVLITNILPLSKELRTQIESQANSIAKAQREITEAEMQQNVERTKAHTATIAATIQADNAAKLLQINTQAQADAIKIQAQAQATAEAEAKRIKADIDLHILTKTAETNAKAVVTEAEGASKAVVMEAEGRQKAGEMDAATFAKYDQFGKIMLQLQQMGKNMDGVFKDANINMVTPGAEQAVGAMLLPSMGSFVNKITRVPDLVGDVVFPPPASNRN